MSDFGVEPDMSRSVIIDDKLDALLAGREAAPGDELAAELSFMLGQIHQAFPPAVVSEQVEDAHITKMMEAAASLPVAETADTVALQAPLLDRIRAGLSRRIAVATLALTTAFGGAAYAGVLPDPIQRAASQVAATVGLDLPEGDEGADLPLPVHDGDEGGDGDEPERWEESDSLDRTVGERSRDGDAAGGGADSEGRDQDDDTDPDSDDGDDDRETDDRDSDDNESDDNESDDVTEDDDDLGDGDSGEAEEPQDSEDSDDQVKEEDETEESSDSSLESEEIAADPTEFQD